MYVSLFDGRRGINNHRQPQGPVHAIDWCKSPAPGQQLRPRSAFRLGIASFTEDFRNRIAVVGLQDDRVLVEDDYGDYPDFVTLVEVTHGYPATALHWQPSTASSFAWSQKAPMTELLATTGDSLRVFEYTSDAPIASSSFVGRQPSSGGHRLSLKAALSGVRPSHTPLYAELPTGRTLPSTAIQGTGPERRGATHQFFVEREDAEPRGHVLNRHDMYSLEFGHVNGGDAAHRARPRGVRRRVVAQFDRYLRLSRRRRLSARVRPTQPRTQHDPLRDAPAKEPAADRPPTLVAAVTHRVQPKRPKLYEHVPPGRHGRPDTRHA